MDVGEMGKIEVVLQASTHRTVPLVGIPAQHPEVRVIQLRTYRRGKGRQGIAHTGPNQTAGLDSRIHRKLCLQLPVQLGAGGDVHHRALLVVGVEQGYLVGFILEVLGKGHRMPEVTKLLVELGLSGHIQLGIAFQLFQLGGDLNHSPASLSAS